MSARNRKPKYCQWWDPVSVGIYKVTPKCINEARFQVVQDGLVYGWVCKIHRKEAIQNGWKIQ